MIEEDEGDAPAGTGHAWPDLLFVTTGLSWWKRRIVTTSDPGSMESGNYTV